MKDSETKGGSPWDLFTGLALTWLMHLIQYPLLGYYHPGKYFYLVGMTQLIYIAPAIFIAKRKGRRWLSIGLFVGASLTFLISTGPWLVFLLTGKLKEIMGN